MAIISRKIVNPLQVRFLEGWAVQEPFDNYGLVYVIEAIRTLFLGILAISLFIVLPRSWNRYGALLEQIVSAY